MSNSLDQPAPIAPPIRRRGAQPGNTNALKHGLYTRNLASPDALESVQFPDGLHEEIDMLRLYIRDVFALAGELRTIAERLEVLRVLCLAFTSLTRLVKVQRLVFGPASEFDAAIDAAIAELIQELDLKL